MEKLSIIIPAYNEEKTIAELLFKVKAVDLSSLSISKEIIVVDDGSSDNTRQEVEKFTDVILLVHDKNKGKGGAVKSGIAHATGSIIVIQDADLEYDPNEYVQVIKPLLDNKAQVVYGSRFLSPTQKNRNRLFLKKHHDAHLLAYIGGRTITICTNLLYGLHLTDEATCYKCFRSDVVKNLIIVNDRFNWEPEITAKIAKRGIDIKEVPISYFPRTISEGKKINWKDGVEAIWTLIKYRFGD